MTSLDLTVLRPARLMSFRMADAASQLPPDALDRFTLDELAQILALSRFSRRPVKLMLHDKGLPNHPAAYDAFVASIPRHPDSTRIHQLADVIAGALRYHAKPAIPDQSI